MKITYIYKGKNEKSFKVYQINLAVEYFSYLCICRGYFIP